MNILEDLWFGNISPWERPFKEDSAYAELLALVIRHQEDMLSNIFFLPYLSIFNDALHALIIRSTSVLVIFEAVSHAFGKCIWTKQACSCFGICSDGISSFCI